MSYKLKTKEEDIENTPIHNFKDGSANGLMYVVNDYVDEGTNEVYLKVLTTPFIDDPGFAYCRINLWDLSIMGCDDEKLQLTEEQYNQIIDSLYEQVDYRKKEDKEFTNFDHIISTLNLIDRSLERAGYKIPEKHYNYSYMKED